MKRWPYVAAIQCVVGAWASIGRTEPSVVASTLFQQAVTKMEAEQFSEACPLLEQSYKLDAKLGTLFTLANCRDREGKIASASARYGEYLRAYNNMTPLDQQKHTTRAGVAEARVRELEAQLPTLKLIWQGELPTGTNIGIDDLVWTGRAPALPFPLDPGPHELVVRQAGTADTVRTVLLEIGQSTTFDVDAEVSLIPSVEPVKVEIGPPPEVPVPIPQRTNPRRLAGFITIGTGAASFVFGGIAGALAVSKKQDAAANCGGAAGYDCNAEGFSAVQSMRSYANASTVGFVMGGILTAGGVVLVLTAPSRSKEKTTTMTLNATGFLGGGMVGLKGAFE